MDGVDELHVAGKGVRARGGAFLAADQEPGDLRRVFEPDHRLKSYPRGNIAALGPVLVIFAIPVLALIGLYSTVPQSASEVLGSLRVWMAKNNRTITVVLCFVFGAFYLFGSLWGL